MKAKDLRGKDVEDLDAGQDDDQVAAAYENISKRLESIRNGKSTDDSDESKESDESEVEAKEEPELEEWKGPRPPKKESEEHNLKKVNLKNLEDEEDEIDPLDDVDEVSKDGKVSKGEEIEDEEEVKKEWEPKENDPLDEEEEGVKGRGGEDAKGDEEGLEESNESEDKEPEERESESLHSEMRRPVESGPADMPEDRDRVARKDAESERETLPEPDTLDDLAAESPFGRKEEDSDEGAKDRGDEDELPYHKDSDEEDEYSIPNLKGPRQDPAHMGYNANPQRESVGQSYSPKGSYMEGNDPNNFFSNHPGQPPKRANKFHLLVLVVIGIAVIGFTVYVLKGGVGGINLGTSTEASPSPSSATATPEATPTPTPQPEVERGNFTVRVLNGTSTSGLAKTVSDKLKEAGYKTAAPGNAEDSDVAQTEVRLKEGTQSAALFERLKLDLAPDYEAIKGENLDSKSKNDAEVIVGAK